MGVRRAPLNAVVFGSSLLFGALAADLDGQCFGDHCLVPSQGDCPAPSQADCLNYPACAGLEGQCCPTGGGMYLWCCNPTTGDDVILAGLPSEQKQIRFSPSAVQLGGVVRMPPTLPPAHLTSVLLGAPTLMSEHDVITTTVHIPPPTVTIMPATPIASVPISGDPYFGLAPGCPLLPPRTFAEGDCVVARGQIEYVTADGDVTVAEGSLGTVVSLDPPGVMWRGHDDLSNAEVQAEQIAFPEPRVGKILVIHRATLPVKVLCLAAVRAKSELGSFDASVKPVECEEGSKDQEFRLMPCGTGNVVHHGKDGPSAGGDTCMELVHPELTLFRPCKDKLDDGQIFQLQVRSKRFQAGVNGFVGCYELGGRNAEELLLLPCSETSTEFSFIDN